MRKYTIKSPSTRVKLKQKRRPKYSRAVISATSGRLKYSVVPELNLTVYGEGNIMVHNGAWHVKTPILIIHNSNADGNAGQRRSYHH